MTTQPTTTIEGVAEQLRLAHEADTFDPFRLVAEMMVSAGAYERWPRDYADVVAEPLNHLETAETGLPETGDATPAARLFWATVAENCGYEHDWKHRCPELECEQLVEDTPAALVAHYAAEHPEEPETYTGADGTAVVMQVPGHPHLAEAACPRCLWSTRGKRHVDVATQAAHEHAGECTGQPPADFSHGALEIARALLVTAGALDATDWETAAAYFDDVEQPDVTLPTPNRRTYRAAFAPLDGGAERNGWTCRIVLTVTHTKGVGYAARLVKEEQLGNMTRTRPFDTWGEVHIDNWCPSTGSGRPAPYSARRAADYGDQIKAALLAGESVVRRVPGEFISVPVGVMV